MNQLLKYAYLNTVYYIDVAEAPFKLNIGRYSLRAGSTASKTRRQHLALYQDLESF